MAHPGGRPTKYYPEICDELIEFFNTEYVRVINKTKRDKSGDEYTWEEETGNWIPTFERFAANHGISTSVLEVWRKEHPEFLEAYTRAKEMQFDIIANNTLVGNYNSNFAALYSKNYHGMVDKQESSQRFVDKDGNDINPFTSIVNIGNPEK